jgi:hypothetical protein
MAQTVQHLPEFKLQYRLKIYVYMFNRKNIRPGTVMHTCNPSYTEGRDQ